MSIANAAKRIYESELKETFEAQHRDDYVAFEPESKTHFVGKTFLEAAMAAKSAFPDRKAFVLRIGHEAAFHLGANMP